MRQSLTTAMVSSLRQAPWLTGRRATDYARILLGLMLLLATGWIIASPHGLDPTGKPLGTDFVSFWTAARLALAGHAASVYDPAAHYAAETAVFGHDVGYYAFFYPPVYLLICLPLALVPYAIALAMWVAGTGFACHAVLRRPLQGRVLPLLAFPAVVLTAAHGQNALLSTALFGAGIALLQRRPLLAGLCFGALVYKPHLALLIPVFLLGTGRWRTLAASAAAAALLSAISLVVFGQNTWIQFLKVAPLARKTLEEGWVEPEKMVSVFAAVRLWDGSVSAAYGLQACAAAAAAVVLIVVARRISRPEAQGAALVAASLLASPFLLDYDLTLLAIPLAWLFSQGQAFGFRPWEKTILLFAFTLPLVVRGAAQMLHVPLGPPVVALLFAAVVGRGLKQCESQRDDTPSAVSSVPALA